MNNNHQRQHEIGYNCTDKYYYKPIDKKTNYVKRAVGIAGDTLEVINGYVYINGQKNQLPERAKLQFSYLVQPKKNKFNQKVMINNYDITDRFGPINSDYTYKFMGISNSSLEKLKKDTNVEWIKNKHYLHLKLILSCLIKKRID